MKAKYIGPTITNGRKALIRRGTRVFVQRVDVARGEAAVRYDPADPLTFQGMLYSPLTTITGVPARHVVVEAEV